MADADRNTQRPAADVAAEKEGTSNTSEDAQRAEELQKMDAKWEDRFGRVEAALEKLLNQKLEIPLPTKKRRWAQSSERETMPPAEWGSQAGWDANSKPQAHEIARGRQGKGKQLLKKKVPSKQPPTKRKRVDSTSSSDLAAISDGEVIEDDALSIECPDDELPRDRKWTGW